MKNATYYAGPKMTVNDFRRISHFVFTNYGIRLPETKKTMLEGRLHKRLKTNNLTSFKEYCDYVFSPQGMQMEIIPMIDAITTNKTDFFREPAHFNFLQEVLLPELSARPQSQPLKIWSAGCSTGEEPYSLAIVLNQYKENSKTIHYTIYATDLSTKVLERAAKAIYPEERVDKIPLPMKRKYFLKSKDRINKTVRVVPELRTKIVFKRVNLMDSLQEVPNDFDIIFCRNVLIYFDRTTQEWVINKLSDKLVKGGYFFLGHSETIAHKNVPLEQIKPTIYRKI